LTTQNHPTVPYYSIQRAGFCLNNIVLEHSEILRRLLKQVREAFLG